MDVRIYFVRDRMRVRLATLTTLERRSIAIPPEFFSEGGFQLTAAPLGGRDSFTSEWIPAGFGDQVEWTVGPRLRLSHFTVRAGGPPLP